MIRVWLVEYCFVRFVRFINLLKLLFYMRGRVRRMVETQHNGGTRRLARNMTAVGQDT